MDHSAAFGNAPQSAGRAVNFKFHRDFFHDRIGSHNGLRRFFVTAFRQGGGQGFHAVGNGRDIQLLPDDAGRSHDYIVFVDAQLLRHKGAHLFRDFNTVAVAGVGIAAVADHCLGHAVGNVLLGYRKGRALYKVRCINRRRMGRHFAEDQRQIVFIVPFPDAAVHTAGGKTFCSADAAFYLFNHNFLPVWPFVFILLFAFLWLRIRKLFLRKR